MNKTLVQQIEDKCIHFNGMANQFCEAGINYEAVKDKTQRPYRLPCVKNTPFYGSSCTEACFRTHEQALEETKKRMENFSIVYIIQALSVISEIPENAGTIKCPKCGKQLRYTRAVNGHVWGKCETQDCLNWVQ